MNRHSAYLNPLLPPEAQTLQDSIAGVSLTGVILFLSGLLVVASGYMSMRPEILGLALHPMLVPIGIAFPFVVSARISEFPQRILWALSLFCGIYLISIVNGTSLSLSEFFKMSAAYITIVTAALLVRKRGDFVAGSLGLCIAIALLAAKGLSDEGTKTVMDGANKNSYSLFALPAMLLTGFICMRLKSTPMILKGGLVACSLLALFVIFIGGNRSGHLGAVLIGLMLFWDQRGRGMILVAIVVGILVLAISQFGDTTVFDERMRQTVEGNKSDDLRLRLIMAGLQVAAENPIIGVSPQRVTHEVANAIGQAGGEIETHNVIAHLICGSGIFSILSLGFLGWSFWSPFPSDEWKKTSNLAPLFEARKLLRMFAVLWIVRGMFTREILYNPAFNLALGLAIGYFILAERVAKSQRSANGGRLPGNLGLSDLSRNPALFDNR